MPCPVPERSAWVQGSENNAELANFKPVLCKVVNKQHG